jgi:hypothetical protein
MSFYWPRIKLSLCARERGGIPIAICRPLRLWPVNSLKSSAQSKSYAPAGPSLSPVRIAPRVADGG